MGTKNITGDLVLNGTVSGAIEGQHVSGTISKDKWYRIAYTGYSVLNDIGIFRLVASAKGMHSITLLTAGITYNKMPSLQQLSHHVFDKTYPLITKARIVYPTEYANKQAYLEVYSASGGTSNIPELDITLTNSCGWTLQAPEVAGEIATGYASKELTFGSAIQSTCVLLTKDDDLNNIWTPGTYRYTTSSYPENAPFNGYAAIVEVWGDDYSVIQRVQRYGTTGAVAQRRVRTDGTTDLGAWQYFVTSSSFNTSTGLAEVRADQIRITNSSTGNTTRYKATLNGTTLSFTEVSS
jgi:hypothetical protein